ncbi:kinase-like domain-containing protein [Russula vinacea]|nr:kinase-like domain-containing protein [Russula vinacea]
MSRIRSKRNFKSLQLDPEPLPIRQAPASKQGAVGAKKRPPPMNLKPKVPTDTPAAGDTSSAVDSFVAIVPPPSAKRMTYHTTLSNTLASLDLNAEVKYDLRDEDLKDLHELGQGNGGSVKKVEHVPSRTIMAKKIVLIDAKPSVRKQILRELQIMHDCHSEYIISFYGAFLSDPNICICMEFMDKGSLDGIYKQIGPIDIEVVAKVAYAVLEGLTYLYDVHRIIHRDIKPSNILCNSKGQIKICDFGVSGELINSIADTFVGTSTYMSPERIQGAQYTVKSDSASDDDSDLSEFEGTLSPARPVPLEKKKGDSKDRKRDRRKSKGVSLQGGGMTMSILELLQHIVNEPAPKLTPEGRFPKEAEDFVNSCLLKEPDHRRTPKDLLNHEWIKHARSARFDLEVWASTF